jgi:O-antigen/teichoic acid export membrane protein
VAREHGVSAVSLTDLIGGTPRIAHGVLWLVGGYLARSLAYLGIVVILARALGPGDFGVLSIFLAFSSGIAYLAGSWPFLAVPILSSRGTPMADVFAAAAQVALLGAAAVALVALPIEALMLGSDPLLALLTVLYALGLLGMTSLYAVYQTMERMPTIAGAQTAERVVGVAGLGLLVVLGSATLHSAQATLALATLLLVGVLVFRLRRLGVRLRLRRGAASPSTALVLRTVGPMVVVSVTAYFIAWIDLLILRAFRGDAEVGHYALAYQVYTFVIQFGSLWVTAALPVHLREATGNSTNDAPLVAADLRLAALAWSAAVAAFAIGVQWAIEPAFGSDFAAAAGPTALLLAGAAPLAAYYAVVPRLLSRDMTRRLAVVSCTGLAINVGLDLLLIPPLGGWGAVIATGGTNVVATAMIVALGGSWRRSMEVVGASLPAGGLIAASVALDDPLASAALLVLAGALGAVAGRALLRSRRAFKGHAGRA